MAQISTVNVPTINVPTMVIYEDNQSIISIANNQGSKRSKRISINFIMFRIRMLRLILYWNTVRQEKCSLMF